VSSVPAETLRELEVLMVEGDLLEVDDVDEHQTLLHLLAVCDSDSYGHSLFEFEVGL